jgi:hypothetical protein
MCLGYVAGRVLVYERAGKWTVLETDSSIKTDPLFKGQHEAGYKAKLHRLGKTLYRSYHFTPPDPTFSEHLPIS